MPAPVSVVGGSGDHRDGNATSRIRSHISARIGRGSIQNQTGRLIRRTPAYVLKKRRNVFVSEKTGHGRVRVGANIDTRVGGGSGSRCVVSIGVPSHIKGERSGHACGGGCGRLCRLVSHGRGRHREAGSGETSSVRLEGLGGDLWH